MEFYTYYDYDETTKDLHGLLYRWYTVNTGKLCPTGWHVPSSDEWDVLEKYVGVDEAFNLKSTSGWNDSGNGTDLCVLNALPSGSDGNSVYWWATDEIGENYGAYSSLRDYKNVFIMGSIVKHTDNSMRCIEDYSKTI